MAIKAKQRQSTTTSSRRAKAKTANDNKPVALTLKVDERTYVKLCTLGATQRRTNQDLLSEALEQFLKRSGA